MARGGEHGARHGAARRGGPRRRAAHRRRDGGRPRGAAASHLTRGHQLRVPAASAAGRGPALLSAGAPVRRRGPQLAPRAVHARAVLARSDLQLGDRLRRLVALGAGPLLGDHAPPHAAPALPARPVALAPPQACKGSRGRGGPHLHPDLHPISRATCRRDAAGYRLCDPRGARKERRPPRRGGQGARARARRGGQGRVDHRGGAAARAAAAAPAVARAGDRLRGVARPAAAERGGAGGLWQDAARDDAHDQPRASRRPATLRGGGGARLRARPPAHPPRARRARPPRQVSRRGRPRRAAPP
mmetsp:Transcript_22820/g.58090  ORF Transcript_22820/g.58090 Transcript_22820/m.58090 type:complete len:302 (+) Transcript_22820:332-1237(+)